VSNGIAAIDAPSEKNTSNRVSCGFLAKDIRNPSQTANRAKRHRNFEKSGSVMLHFCD
jgi:hypothetical protein